jgi:hypothetical protein
MGGWGRKLSEVDEEDRACILSFKNVVHSGHFSCDYRFHGELPVIVSVMVLMVVAKVVLKVY